jgi:putative ATPase
MDLFDSTTDSGSIPLAERLRPHQLDDMVGQQHLIGDGKLLRRLIESDQLSSVLFWGPPGTGKTTLAQVIASTSRCNFVFFSAVLQGVKDVREIVAKAQEEKKYYNRRTLLFVDEIHRFNKAQQDAFLPYVEKGDIILIGATTENPSFEINAALLSRSQVFVLKPLQTEDIRTLLTRALSDPKGLPHPRPEVSEEALDFLAARADGDARIALNALEVAVSAPIDGKVDLAIAEETLQKKTILYDKGAEEHYNVISAFIKSLRGSDPDGALYWLARMLEAGEDPMFIVRRLVIFASEDVGNADPRGLQLAIAAQQAVHFIGLPEARITLAQTVTYLATAPKSNASYAGINAAQAEVRNSGALPVPLHIRNAPTKLMKQLDYGKGYKYAHDNPDGYQAQDYLPDEIKDRTFYTPTDHGYEKMIGERMAYWQQIKHGEKSKKDSD